MIELLSPAGDIESLYYAIYAGCDAVYIGGKNFGARKYAKNFSDEELKQARYITKLYGVKLYITLNTLVYDSEWEEITEYIRFLYKLGVDAVIVQDIGLVDYINKKFPNLTIHASTQMNAHNKNTLEKLKQMGVKRVVLAREVSLDNINNIDTDIEREIFIHGALCVSYSGCCLLSSYIGKRSGNRGECAGTCRLPYELYNGNDKINTDGKYLLSMKDLCTLEKLDQILKSNVNSLKIEGRMKSKEYVYYVTKIYRKYIDMYYKCGNIKIDEEDNNLLKILFNRNFTNGYLFDSKNNINIKTSNNIGLYIGNVIDYKNNKCKIKLNKKLEVNDGIRIVNRNSEIGLIVNKIEENKNNIVTIFPNHKIEVGSKVFITSKNNLVVNPTKIDINMNIEINDNSIIVEIYNDRKNITCKSNNIIERAKNNPIDIEFIKKHMSKLGNTPFKINKINITNIPNNIYINIGKINEFRRECIQKFIDELTKNDIDFIENDYNLKTYKSNSNIEYSVFVKNEAQFNEVIKYPLNRIYVDYNIYNKYKNMYNNLVLVLPRINYIDYKLNNERLLIRELGSLKYASDNYVISDYTLNVTNSYSVNYLKENNVKRITLSTEFDKNNIDIKDKNDLEMIIYGKIELAISKYCVISNVLNKNKGCKLCRDNNFYLSDRLNSKYKLINDEYCNSIILSSRPYDNIDLIEKYIDSGISNFRLNFYDESEDTIINILNKIYK